MATSLNLNQLSKIQEVANGKPEVAHRLKMEAESKLKDMTVAYVLGAIFGAFGAHRLYAGQIMLGLLQFVSVLCVVGVLWVLADVFLTKGVIESVNNKIVDEVIDSYVILNSTNSSGV